MTRFPRLRALAAVAASAALVTGCTTLPNNTEPQAIRSFEPQIEEDSDLGPQPGSPTCCCATSTPPARTRPRTIRWPGPIWRGHRPAVGPARVDPGGQPHRPRHRRRVDQ